MRKQIQRETDLGRLEPWRLPKTDVTIQTSRKKTYQ